MANNSIYGSKFYLTSRAGEQLELNHSKTETQNVTKPEFSEYVSTVSQTELTNKEQNNAIRYGALASMSLGKSNAIQQLNSYVRNIQLQGKLA